ncbi:MAG: putative porin [Acidobacteriales bacterium]|nr:putative porin [Terriglobales bacterium]
MPLAAKFRILILVLTTTAAFAQNAESPSSPAQTSSPPPAHHSVHTSNKIGKKGTASTAVQQDVKALREMVAAQQEQLELQRNEMGELKGQIQQLLDATQQNNAAAQRAQNSVEQAQTTASQAQQSATDAERLAQQASSKEAEVTAALAAVDTRTSTQNRELSALQSLAGRFRFTGDIRIRGEDYFQHALPDRNRARLRVRFGFDGQLNEDFMGGIALATGTLGDPTTTNETLTNVFDRKTIALDRGWITYNPVAHHWLSVTGGKFAYLWQRTSVTGDPDLNPEGFDEKASFNLNGPFLKNFTVQGIELLYNESSVGQDSYALGGQISMKLQAGPWTATPSFLSLKWNRPDAILQQSAFAVGATTTGVGGTTPIGPFPVPGEGPGCAKGLSLPSFAPCVFAPNGMTNATFVDSKGVPHFYSGYNYADFILNNQVKTGWARLPVNLLLEFEDNLDAEHHPLDAKGNVLTNLGSQNKEYGADFSLGQTKNRNDVQIGYAWLRQEQDSVLASFAESDQRAPTNIIQNRYYLWWKPRTNTVAGITWWHGRVLNSNLENNAALFNNWSTANKGATISAPGQVEPYLNRFQFDLIYTF